MKFNIIFILPLFFLLPLRVFSAIPSVEGLFKNLNNKPVTEKLVTVKAKVKTDYLTEKDASQTKEYYLKVMIFQRNDFQIDILHAIYTSPDFNSKSIVDYKYTEDINSVVAKGQEDITLSFDAILTMLGTNNALVMTSLMKKRNNDFVGDKDVLNQDKIKLLESYLAFLKSGQPVDSISNPMKGKTDAEKVKLEELLSTRFYKPQATTKMTKIGKDIFWVLKLENVDAFFDAETLRLVKMKANMFDQIVLYDFSNYILMDGSHEFPKTISVLNEGKGLSKLTILDVDYSADKNSLFKKSVTEITKMKLSPEKSPVQNPSFLLMN